MPEIKHNFLQGKMNKDLDERLVPNGQYRDALNIEISTSEGSDVGTVQNILGNKHISTTPSNMLGRNIPGEHKWCIGSISDEKNDALYWFIASEEYEDLMSISNQCQIPNLSPGNTGSIVSSSFGNPINTQQGLFQDTLRHANLKDMILEYKDGDITPVFVDKHTIIIKIWDCESSMSQIDIANGMLSRPTGHTLTASSGFLNNGLGWGFSANTQNKIEIMDIRGLKVGYTVKGIGTKHSIQNAGFIDYFTDEDAAWTTEIINIIPGIEWHDLTGQLRQTGIITLNKTVYPSPLTLTGVNNITHLVFEKNVLDFSKDRLITGINIIDDMLFWTDNFSEPKKINIARSKEGTHSNGDKQTRLIVDDRNVNYNSGVDAEQEHITVIKKPPTSAPKLEMKANRSGYSYGTCNYNFGSIFAGDTVNLSISAFTGSNALHYKVGDTLLLKLDINNVHQYAELRNGTVEHDVRVIITGMAGNSYTCTVLNIHTLFSFSSTIFGVILDETAEELFSLKFPRFALRYKYEDGEYSSYGPFSDIAFITDLYDFYPNKGYNLGMVNQLRELTLKNIIPPDTPLDVVQVDILYKETNSPNIYIVEQIKKSTEVSGVNLWDSNLFKVESEVIYAVLPSNQLLRPWDNVPRKALAQEVTGNRLVYANYLQNYNLKDINQDYVNMDFDVWLKDRDYFKQSIKSMRTYQLGVVYRDVYGRETPVQTSSNASLKVSKLDADKTNRIVATITNNPPGFADSYKIFVKETSSEYYNLPLDRLYDAEDGNVWLSFASHDRNKVKDEDTLILKKALDGGLVTDVAKYKVLDIKNEAPDFIKTRKSILGDRSMRDVTWVPTNPIATNLPMKDVWPIPGNDMFFINTAGVLNTPLENFHRKITEEGVKEAPLYVRFFGEDDGGIRNDKMTNWYEIDTANRGGDTDGDGKIQTGDGHYRIRVKKDFGSDTEWINSSTSVLNPVLTDETTNGHLVVQIAQRVKTEEPKFQGRFFVKVLYDTTIQDMIINPQDMHAATKVAIDAYYVKDFDQEDPITNATYDASAHELTIANFNLSGPSGEAQFGVYTHTGGVVTGTAPTEHNPTFVPCIPPTGYAYAFNVPMSGGTPHTFPGFQCRGFSASLDMDPVPTSVTYQTTTQGVTNTVPNAFFDLWTPALTQADLWKPHGVEIPTTAYYSRHAWKQIKLKLKSAGSKWFIDEAFATAEEPYWGVGSRQNPLALADSRGSGDTLYLGWNLFSSNRHVHDAEWGLSDSSHVRSWPIFSQASGYGGNPVGTYGLLPRSGGLTMNYHVSNQFTKNNVVIHGLGLSPHDPHVTSTPLSSGFDNPNNDYNLHPYPPHNTPFTNSLDPTHAQHTNNPDVTPQELVDSMSEWKFYSEGLGVTGNQIDISYIAPTEESDLGSNNQVLGWNNGDDKSWSEHSNYTITNDSSSFSTSQNDVEFVDNLVSGKYIAFTSDPQRRVYKILNVTKFYKRNYAAFLFDDTYPFAADRYIYQGCSRDTNHTAYSSGCDAAHEAQMEKMFDQNHRGENFRLTFRLTLDQPIGFNGYTPTVAGTINDWYGNSQSWSTPTIDTNPVGIEIVELENPDFGFSATGEVEFPDDPAVWETEPDETADLDIYYEATEVIPLRLSENNNTLFAPVGSKATLQVLETIAGIYSSITGFTNTVGGLDFGTPTVVSWNGNEVTLDHLANTSTMDYLINNYGEQKIVFTKEDGSYITGVYDGLGGDIISSGVDFSYTIKIKEDLSKSEHGLAWHNCYSFSNGVESDRIRDNYNAVTLDNGVVASSTFEEKFAEERRGSGLIYSGLYNSTSGVNNLNQFIQAEKITKDLNPTYGTIQKLHSRNTDLIALCEDKVLKILANKDAVYNADNNMQLTATQNVLGQSVPFIGEFGISKNPESFASESYRAYFTDKQRGAVLRLSKDGLTNIAEHGMSDWFKDNLKLGKQLIGSHDDRKEDYNITIKTDDVETTKTLSFSEIVTGWVSFKSFIPENGISMASDYYTFKNGRLWKHHQPQLSVTPHIWSDCAFVNAKNYNVFYGVDSHTSTIDVMLNDSPSTIKSFRTLGYEGSQSKVTNFTTATTTDAAGNVLANIGDGEFYNIEPDKKGWFVNSIVTDQQKGSIKEFIEKEGLWDNYIIGDPKTTLTIDPEEFSFQGIGIAGITSTTSVGGCMDVNAWNYNPAANVDSGNCIEKIIDCMRPGYDNYNPAANEQCASCCYIEGCTDPTMFGYSHLATQDDGSCEPYYYGCTDPAAFNYDEEFNTDDGSCIAIVDGCTNPLASNFNPLANTNDGSCIPCILGCTDDGNMGNTWWNDTTVIVDGGNQGLSYSSLFSQFSGSYPAGAVMNYNQNATCDDGSCRYGGSGGGVHGCLDDGFQAWSPIPGTAAENHNCSSSTSPNSLVWCNDNVTNHNWTCIYAGCTVRRTPYAAFYGLAGASNYNVNYNLDDGSCLYPGCMDPTADNYDVDAVFDNGTCTYSGGCMVNGSPATNTVSVSAAYTNQETLNGTYSANGSITLTSNCFSGCNTPYTCAWSIGSTPVQNTVQPLGTPYTPSFGSCEIYGPAGGTYSVLVTDDIGCTIRRSFTITGPTNLFSGCTDSDASNFDFAIDATHTDDGSCYGCMDPMGPNYCSTCLSDCSNAVSGGDVSCCGFISGCTDALATNYDPLAVGASTGCQYNGCTDTAANNSGAINHPTTGASTGQTRSLASINDDGSCEFWGCLDPNQTPGNYNQCVDGSGATIACTHDCAGNLTSTNTSCCTDCGTFTTQALAVVVEYANMPTGNSLVSIRDVSTYGTSTGRITVGAGPQTTFWGVYQTLGDLVDSVGTNWGTPVTATNTSKRWDQLPAETYTFTITGHHSANSGIYDGCTHVFDVDVNEPAAPCGLTVTGGTFNSTTLDIEGVDVAGGVGTLSYVVTYSNNTTSQGSITNSTGNAFSGYPAGWASGNVDITVTDAANGCTSSITVNVSAYPCGLQVFQTHTNVTTNGGSDGAAIITSGGTNAWASHEIIITGPSGYSNTTSGPTTFGTAVSNLSAGSYTATMTDLTNNSCADSVTFTITEPNGCGGNYRVRNNAGGNYGTGSGTYAATITGATNGAGGAISNLLAWNGLSPTTQTGLGIPYSITVTGPGGYSSTTAQAGFNGFNLTGLTNGTYSVVATDSTTNNNGSGCVSPSQSFTVGNTILVLGCTDPIANNYNASATSGNVDAVSSCLYNCNMTVNTVTINSDETCGADGSFTATGVSSGNNVVGYDYTITPNPYTGVAGSSYTNTSANMNFSSGWSIHDGSYTLTVDEQNSGSPYNDTGCSASTTFTIGAAVTGCNDSSANNYVAGVTCLTNQQDECCYTVAASATGNFITTNPTTSDGSLSISLSGLPTATSPASAGNAVVSYRVTGYGNASSYSYPGGSSFTTLGTSTLVIGGPTTWDTINLTGLAHGTYTLQAYVNGSTLTNNSCTLQWWSFTIIPG